MTVKADSKEPSMKILVSGAQAVAPAAAQLLGCGGRRDLKSDAELRNTPAKAKPL